MSQKEIAAYLLQLSPMEKQILNIAKTHLETSFSLVKSIGFQEWQQAQAQAQQAQAQAEQAQAQQAQAQQAQAQAQQAQGQAASMPPAPPSSKT